MMDFICTLPVIAGLFTTCAPQSPLATGYVEGEYVLVAPVETGRIERLEKKRGDRVTRGEVLVGMEAADAEIAVHEAEAALEQAKAQLANLKEGRRQEEIAVIQATLISAEAQAAEAKRVFERQRDLLDRGIAARQIYDQAETAKAQAEALVNQTKANLAVARLPARPMEIDAAEALVKQTSAKLDNARWRLDHRKLKAPENGSVEDIIRRVGEVAGPSQPVLSLLPDGAIKIRLYVPERFISSLSLGTVLKVRCDGCGANLRAKITYLSSSPEFTPPVIYSLENRQKLVYLVEARPEGAATKLKPGLIVDAVVGE